jgi:16S rRNA (adenine1518-N6/adenine1519-N6)-dimethyltransferase
MQHRPRKRFGQNFLADASVVRKIVAAIAPRAGDRMVEIGPGLGALTAPLLQTLKHLHVVEIDRDLIARLEREFPADRLTVHAGDALAFDFGSLGEKLRIVGNLPYNISTPLLFHLARFAPQVEDMHFMLQKEVVERMAAAPGSAAYGRLSVMLQYRFMVERLFVVPPGAFRPAPKVDSAIVRLVPYATLPHLAGDEALFGRLVAAAFGQRRKTLRNTLRDFLSADDWAATGIDPGLRAENLGVDAFVRLANLSKARAA